MYSIPISKDEDSVQPLPHPGAQHCATGRGRRPGGRGEDHGDPSVDDGEQHLRLPAAVAGQHGQFINEKKSPVELVYLVFIESISRFRERWDICRK